MRESINEQETQTEKEEEPGNPQGKDRALDESEGGEGGP
jgi:hypothetical protein